MRVKDPVVYNKSLVDLKTLKNPAYIVGWLQLAFSGKAALNGRNCNGIIKL